MPTPAALLELAMNSEPSTVIDLALSACEVRADLESDTGSTWDGAAWDAWKSIATKLGELRALALKLEEQARTMPPAAPCVVLACDEGAS